LGEAAMSISLMSISLMSISLMSISLMPISRCLGVKLFGTASARVSIK